MAERLTTPPTRDLLLVPADHPWIDAFETVRRRQEVSDLSDFAPSTDDPRYAAIMCELICIDLEYHWSHGNTRDLEAYRTRYPTLFHHHDLEKRLQLELNRQRANFASSDRRHGQFSVTRHEPRYPDKQIGPFEIILELGRGATARTFLARQGNLANRLVAIKVTETELDESRCLARLQHTNIVPIHSVDRFDPFTVLCMPYCGATTFADLSARIHPTRQHLSADCLATTVRECHSTRIRLQMVASATPSSCSARTAELADSVAFDAPRGPGLAQLETSTYVSGILMMFQQLASGLHHAHERGIIHQDIKPANILLADDGTPMLLDFNLAKDTARQPGETNSHWGGTIAYMPPERLQQIAAGVDAPADPRSDLWSLGLVFLELLVGHDADSTQPPSTLPEMIRYFEKRNGRMANRLSMASAEVTPAVQSIMARCLAEHPSARYDSAKQLAEDIERHRQNLPLRFAPERSWLERARKWGRRHRNFLSVTAVFLAALALLVPLLAIANFRGHKLTQVSREAAMAQYRTNYEMFMDESAVVMNLLTLPRHELENRLDATAMADAVIQRWEHAGRIASQHVPLHRAIPLDDLRALELRLAELHATRAAKSLMQAQRAKSPADRDSLLREASQWVARGTLAHRQRPSIVLSWQTATIDAAQRDQSHDLPTMGPPNEAMPSREMASGEMAPWETALMGRWHADAGNFSQAVPLLLQAVRAAPQRFDYWLNYGYAQLRRSEYVDATNAFTACIATRADLHHPYFLRGLAQLRQGSFPAAEHDFTTVLQMQPHMPEGLIHRAIARLEQSQWNEAMSDLDQVLHQPRLRVWALVLRAQAHEGLGHLSAAESDRQEALRSEVTDSVSAIALALMLMPIQPQRSLELLELASTIDPDSLEAAQNRAHVLSERLGRPAEAIAVLDRLLQLDEHNLQALGGRAVLHARLGNREAAQRDASICLGLDRSPFTLYQIAGVYALTSPAVPPDKEQAMKLISIALQVDPQLTQLVDTDPDLAVLRGDPLFEQWVEQGKSIHRLQDRIDPAP